MPRGQGRPRTAPPAAHESDAPHSAELLRAVGRSGRRRDCSAVSLNSPSAPVANRDPAFFTGDPDENRTRVIGVRGALKDADRACFVLNPFFRADLFPRSKTRAIAEGGQNSRAKTLTLRVFGVVGRESARWRALHQPTMRPRAGVSMKVGKVGGHAV